MKTLYSLLIILSISVSPLLSQINVTLEDWGDTYSQPLYMIPWVEDDFILIEKTGAVKTVDENGNEIEEIFNLSDQMGSTGGERGLLGVALHPDYPSEPYIYFNYTNTNNNTDIVEYEYDPSSSEIDASSRELLLNISQPYTNHNGGYITFGPDDYLYIGMGDGGSGGDPMNNAQNLNSLLGKILRIDVDNGDPYAIPESNPFAEAQDTQAEIWSYGWRNPWRFSFDKENGDMWVGDVGQNSVEEVSYEASDAPGGLNYGWRCYEGDQEYDQSGNCNGPFVFPIITRDRVTGDRSITGGYRYRGDVTGFENHYMFADFSSGSIYMAVLNTSDEMELDTLLTVGNESSIVSFAEDKDGDLYIMTIGGTIYKVNLQCNIAPPTISAEETMLCPGDSTLLNVQSGEEDISWYRNTELIEGENSTELYVKEAGLYTARVNGLCNSDNSNVIEVEIRDELPIPTITVDEEEMSLETDMNYEEYVWFYSETSTDKNDFMPYDTTNFAVLPGAESGFYYVVVLDEFGCTQESEVIEADFTTSAVSQEFYSVTFFPNPVEDAVNIQTDKHLDDVNIEIIDLGGNVIHSQKTDLPSKVDLNNLNAGVYFLKIQSEKKSYFTKIIKQ